MNINLGDAVGRSVIGGKITRLSKDNYFNCLGGSVAAADILGREILACSYNGKTILFLIDGIKESIFLSEEDIVDKG